MLKGKLHLKIISNMCASDTFSRNCEGVKTYWPFAARVPFCRPSSVRLPRRNPPARPWWWRSVHRVEAAARTLWGLAARSETTRMNEDGSQGKTERMGVQKKSMDKHLWVGKSNFLHILELSVGTICEFRGCTCVSRWIWFTLHTYLGWGIRIGVHTCVGRGIWGSYT